jgi:hypothetical protein
LNGSTHLMKIFIYVGPPKTGTSVIQHWCNTNREVLAREEIYYPTHKLDANGISSGNLLNLYDRNETSGELTYSDKKFNLLVNQAKSQALILSFYLLNFSSRKSTSWRKIFQPLFFSLT